MTGEKAVAARREIDEEERRWINDHLSEKQARRLAQIDLQWEGPSALISRPIVADALRLTDEQRAALKRAIDEHRSRRAPGTLVLGEEKRLAEQALATLSDEQKKTWFSILGDPLRPAARLVAAQPGAIARMGRTGADGADLIRSIRPRPMQGHARPEGRPEPVGAIQSDPIGFRPGGRGRPSGVRTRGCRGAGRSRTRRRSWRGGRGRGRAPRRARRAPWRGCRRGSSSRPGCSGGAARRGCTARRAPARRSPARAGGSSCSTSPARSRRRSGEGRSAAATSRGFSASR